MPKNYSWSENLFSFPLIYQSTHLINKHVSYLWFSRPCAQHPCFLIFFEVMEIGQVIGLLADDSIQVIPICVFKVS